ncbi:hypothetical protein [Spirosoma gilvum]
MEAQKEPKAIRGEDLTPEQREKWLAFYRKVMQSKRETQAEMREYAKTEEYKESIKRLDERNAGRGTPFV